MTDRYWDTDAQRWVWPDDTLRDAIFFALRQEAERLGIPDVTEEDLESLARAVVERLWSEGAASIAANSLREAADDPRWDRDEHRHVREWLHGRADALDFGEATT